MEQSDTYSKERRTSCYPCSTSSRPLADEVDIVKCAVEQFGGSTILIGHSYGGEVFFSTFVFPFGFSIGTLSETKTKGQ
jgi:hypothetical protein